MTPRQLSPLARWTASAGIIALSLALAPAAVAQAPTAAAAPSCSVAWGSADTASGDLSAAASITNVRSGRHACYDRLVVNLSGRLTGYSVKYVDTVFADGSGLPVSLRGGARLQVVVMAPSYDPAGLATFKPANRSELTNVSGFSTFRQVADAASFEGLTTIGLGVRARLPYRAFILSGPGNASRLVIDVAHRW